MKKKKKKPVLQIKDAVILQKILSNAIYKYTAACRNISQALSEPHNDPVRRAKQEWQSPVCRYLRYSAAWPEVTRQRMSDFRQKQTHTFSLFVWCSSLHLWFPKCGPGDSGGGPWGLQWESARSKPVSLSRWTYLPFHLCSLKSVQGSFPETTWYVPSQEMECRSRELSSSIKPDLQETC